MATQKINGVYHVSNTQQGGGGGSDPEAVKYTPQTLTEAQKTQARTNIGAADEISGITSATASVDNTTGTPSVSVNLSNQQLSLAFSGLKGAQGNTGSSVDYPYELVNNVTTDDATKGLSAAQGVVLQGEIDQLGQDVTNIKQTIGELPTTEDVTDQYELGSGQQAYGNVGQAIAIGSLAGYGYYRINAESIEPGERMTVSFYSGTAQVSSHVQFVNSSNIITRRLYVGATRSTQFVFDLEFEEGEVAVYVSGVLNKFILTKIIGQSLPDTITNVLTQHEEEIANLTDLSEYSGDYSILASESGKQSYGSVGSTINIGNYGGLEYVKITGTPLVKLKTNPVAVVGSYVQYVDENDKIISLDLTSYTKNTEYNYVVSYPEGAVAVYINGSIGTIELSGEEGESVKARVTTLVDEATVALSTDTKYSLADAKTAYQDHTYDGFLLVASGSIGATVAKVQSRGEVTLRIPLTGVESITYPLFKSSSIYGSVAVTPDNYVVWEKANTVEDDGTPMKVYVSDLNGAAYLLVCCTPDLSGEVVISNYTGESMPLKEYVLREMPSDDYLGTSTVKVLNLAGASKLYQALLERAGGANSGGMDAFNDFGAMPSCIYGEPNAFLADGTIDSNTARIKYSDVIAKYDALMAKYPNYITKTSVGYDASGTIEMFYYTFTPKYWEQSVYLQAGVHGWEPDPVFALAEMMYLISNAYGTDDLTEPYVPGNIPLKYLRGKVKFTIFPVVNPWGFNNRGDCGIDKRSVAQNNYNGVQLNAAWGSDEAEAVAVRTLVSNLASELSFAIDMHSTVWSDSRTRYGCFCGGVNSGAENLRTIYRTYEWLYQFYNVKYPDIVEGDQVPNELGSGYASIGYMSNTFNSYFYSNYNIQTSTMEFSDHVWTPELHTSVALSVAVNMYMNQIIQQINDKYKENSETGIPAEDMFPAKG